MQKLHLEDIPPPMDDWVDIIRRLKNFKQVTIGVVGKIY